MLNDVILKFILDVYARMALNVYVFTYSFPYKSINNQLIINIMKKYIMFPGGFKPPTKGHYSVLSRFKSYHKFYIIISKYI